MFTYLLSRSFIVAAARSRGLARRATALGLVVALVGLAALLYPATVPHLMHHAQHHAGTHGTALCSWLCAAGQGVEGAAAPIAHRYDPVDRLESLVSVNPDHPDLLSVSSRAPPTV
ncbi:hypothetical protein [Nitrospira tepida]|uniref:hypothetical protein n=1 Tax=Nitrospira tepida TaxID=2973512 RepID=UPI00259C789D|nr:hypothetical protein [Nitrospira tepida]